MANRNRDEQLVQKIKVLKESRQAWLAAGETEAVASLDKRIEALSVELDEANQGLIDRTEQMMVIDTQGMLKSFRERLDKLESKAPKSKFKPSKNDATVRIADAMEEFLHFEVERRSRNRKILNATRAALELAYEEVGEKLPTEAKIAIDIIKGIIDTLDE